MILLSPIADPNYVILLAVLFAMIAEAVRRGEPQPRLIYAAVASCFVVFANYSLALMNKWRTADR